VKSGGLLELLSLLFLHGFGLTRAAHPGSNAIMPFIFTQRGCDDLVRALVLTILLVE
jgi:hypothetical protein